MRILKLSMINEFPHLTSRLNFIELCPDHMINIEVWVCLSEFERYVYGVTSQYSRITENLPGTSSTFSIAQLQLDIYYYTLSWDKLSKVFKELKKRINNVSKFPNTLPKGFINNFRQLRKRIDHLLGEFRASVRNKYEHPSLKPMEVGNLAGFGNLVSDSQGNIKSHVGKDEFAIVRKEHIVKLNSLWVELIDIFVKYFSNKTSSNELFRLKKQFEENIDMILGEYNQYRHECKVEEANQILRQILLYEIYFSDNYVPLRQEIKDKLNSIFFQGRSTQ